MTSRRTSRFSAVANTLNKLVRRRSTRVKRRSTRQRILEQLENRQLMALNILSVTPGDGAINWALDTNLTIRFDAPVAKGQGAINVVQNSTGVLGVAVDVNSSNVVIAGDTVTIDLPQNLLARTEYTVRIDDGAFVDLSSTTTTGATLLTQNFDLQPLSPYTTQQGGDGTDFSRTPPLGYVFDNTNMPSGGVPEWTGWSMADKLSWIRQADQGRSAFTKGSGTIVLGDPDEYADTDPSPSGPFNAAFLTRPISLTGVAPNTAVLEFDSSFRPENSQIGLLEVRFDSGAWEQLIQLDPTNTSNQDPFEAGVVNVNVNERLVSGTNTGTSSNGRGNVPFRAVNNPAGASTMQFRWNVSGGNTWWWALDNLKVKGNLTGVPFLGINDNTTWNLDIPKLGVTLTPTSMSENGGTSVGTVTRNGIPTDPLTVTLVSGDTTEATVPASVVIPAGQFSATFPITAVDDAIVDRTQTVNITASASGFANSVASIDVLDDDGPKIVTLSPADNATGVDYKSNLVVTFNAPVKLGSGLINIFRASDNLLVASIDVNDASKVTLAGSTLTIDPPINLRGLTEYYVLMDSGVVLDTSTTVTNGATVLQQNFNALPLGPFTSGSGGDGTDFTKTPPLGFSISGTTGVGNPNFDGWTFVDKASWLGISSGGAQRAGFNLSTGNLAVADASLWGGEFPNQLNSFLRTTPIDLSKLVPGTAVFEFDANYLAGLPRIGIVEVSYDGGSTWVDLAHFDNSDVTNSHFTFSNTGVTGTGITRTGTNALNNPASGSMVFRLSLQSALNGWLAVDNIKVTADVVGLPFPGITDPTTWSFTTAEAPTVTVTIDRTSMSENGGTATGTVTRNLSTTGALVVSLSSSDTTAATVPANVTIPDGAAFVTFPITAVDDAVIDGDKTAVIDATVPEFFSVTASINVLDDEFPKSTSFSPADNATAVPVDANLVVQFDQNVKKGNGFVHVIRTSDGKAVQSIDIQSSNVTVSGNTVTINPPANLAGLTNYYVSFENGAILSAASVVQKGARLLSQDFELLPLQAAVTETVGLTGNGKDWTPTSPSGFAVDNSQMPPGGVPEWYGWTFADKTFWQTQGDQFRANFTRGQGTVATGDTDEWDDLSVPNNSFNSFLTTAPIDLSNVAARSVVFEFDSSFRPENAAALNNQVGLLDVSYDNGATWSNAFRYDITNTSASETSSNINERKVVRLDNPVTGNPTSGLMKFRFNLTGTNDFWWAIDNMVVTAETNGLPYPGIANTDATTWNFTTAEAATVTLSGATTPIAENAGTTTLTVARNLGTVGDLVVNLTLSSSDSALITVPASVTIPDGQSSVSFAVTAIDDTNADGLKIPTITASAVGFVGSTLNVSITDNEVIDVIITEIMYNPAGSEPRTEWLEVVNRGTTTADLSGWSLDDEDKPNWGAIPAGTLLAPGQVGVIFNSFFGLNTADAFRTAWAVPTSAVVVGSFWAVFDNEPSATGTLNEDVVLQDAGKTVLDQVNFDDDGTVWPAGANGPSIYLTNLTADNNVGTNWARSVVGTASARNPVNGTAYNTADVGSPGVVSTNTVPVIASDAAAVSGNEGTTITNTGTWSDANASDVVTLTASVGAVVKNANGTWSWSIASTDNQAATTVTITANDGNGGVSTTSFTYTVNNVAPAVAATNSAVSGIVLTTITNTGTYGDVPADTVTLTASTGTIVNNGNGTWSWSITPSAGINNQTVTITAADEDGGSSTTTFSLTAVVDVVDRKLFYNGSGFETVGGVAAALDTSKVMLRSGTATQTTAFANVSNYTRGINGAVLDVAGLANTALTAADFILRVAPTGASGVVNPSTWANAPTPSALVVTAGTATTPARVQLEWTDNQIQNTWLQIVVRANANTGLTTPAVFYLGHAQAEINGVAPYRVSIADLSPVQTGISTSLVGVNDLRDLNKDRRVTVADLSFVQVRISTTVNLNNITVPIAGSAEEGASGSGGGGGGGSGGGAGGAIFMQGAPSVASLAGKIGESIVNSSQPVARDVALATLASRPTLTSRVASSLSMDLIKPIQPQQTSQEATDEFFAKLGQQF